MLACTTCHRRHRTYSALATCRWPHADVRGEGPWAVGAACPPVTVHLHASQEDAARAKAQIDRTGCGSRCEGRHFVHSLDAIPPIRATRTPRPNRDVSDWSGLR